jgi:chromosome segregation ATPase
VLSDPSGRRAELQLLLEERDGLRSQLKKRGSQHPPRTLTIGPQFTSAIDREYAALSQQVLEKRAQLAQLMQSDEALRREELQEEAKVFYQEFSRLQDLTMQQQITLADAQKELDDLLAEDGPALFEKQTQHINRLQEKLQRFEYANVKLARKIKKLKAEQQRQIDARNADAEAKIEELTRQIAEVEKETQEVEDKIRQSEERHIQVMNTLQASLKEKGIATPNHQTSNQ